MIIANKSVNVQLGQENIFPVWKDFEQKLHF